MFLIPYTPFQGVRAQVTDLNPDFPNEVLVELNLRERALFALLAGSV